MSILGRGSQREEEKGKKFEKKSIEWKWFSEWARFELKIYDSWVENDLWRLVGAQWVFLEQKRVVSGLALHFWSHPHEKATTACAFFANQASRIDPPIIKDWSPRNKSNKDRSLSLQKLETTGFSYWNLFNSTKGRYKHLFLLCQWFILILTCIHVLIMQIYVDLVSQTYDIIIIGKGYHKKLSHTYRGDFGS